jgi:hypothetical protein
VREAARHRDGAALQHSAHALKGAVAYFDATGAAVEAARRLEAAGDDHWDAADHDLAVLETEMERIAGALAVLAGQRDKH